MRVLAIFVVLICPLVVVRPVSAQQADSDEVATAYCNFDDGNQVSVQYNNTGKSKDEPHNGRVWEPGGSPMTLYTQVPIVLNNVTIPVGAFHVYVMPNKKEWTLIVNKNVTAGSKYDESQDLARAPMEVGDLGQPVKPIQVVLAHMGAKTCSIRVYYGTVGALAEFTEK
jgi:hypothetical protein